MKQAFVMKKFNYFKYDDFACPCCGKNETSNELIEMLDIARSKAGIPFVINSGFRCEAHNTKVGGVRGSAHLKGLAADIRAVAPYNRFLIIKAIYDSNFTRIRVKTTFVHVDIDKTKPQETFGLY